MGKTTFLGINTDGNAEYGQSQPALAQGNGICVTKPFQNNSNPRFWFHQFTNGDICNSWIGTLLPKFKPNTDSNPSLPFQAKRKGRDHIRRPRENARKKSRMSHLISLTPAWKALVASLIWISLQLLSLPR